MSKRSSIFFFAVCAMIIVPSDAFSAVLEIPPEAKTLSGIVLDVKAPLNRKLDELRKTYGIKEVKAGEFHFTDKKGQVVLTIVANRSLNAEGTQRVEEFLYTNRYGQLILHEKVITHGENLRFHDFEKRLYQTGVENYDLASDEETRKEGTIGMGAGTVFRVLTSRGEAGKVAIKRHQISVGESQQIEIRDTVDTENNYRTYEYSILEQQMMIRANGGFRGGWANWRGTLRITVRTVPGLLVPEVIYEKIGTSRATALNGSESFSRELYGKLIIPFIENGLVRLISQVVASRWVWPASESMQTIGTESKFLNELIVIRNEVNQAKTNPAVLSLVDVKLSVIIKEIQRNDSREVTWFLDHEESFKGRHTLRVKKVKTDWMLLGSEEFYVDGLKRTPARYQSDFAGFGVQDALVSFQKLVKEDIRSAMCPDCAENSLFAGDDK